MEVVAFDIGYNATKLASSTGTEAIFPSVIGTPFEGRFSLAQASHNRMIIRLDSTRAWPVGETALRQSSYTSSRRDAGWVLEEPWEILLCAALSEVYEARTTVNVVTGLPLEDWKNWKDRLRNHLIGEHKFKRNDRRAQTVTVNDAVIITQAYGSLLDQALSPTGRILNNIFATGMIAVADLGGNTMNLTACRALEVISQWTHGDGLGLLRALDNVARDIHAAHPTIRPKTHEVAQWLRDGEFSVGGEKQWIAPFADPYLEPLVEMIVNRMTEVWPEPGRYDVVLLTGGGALAVGKILKDRMAGIYPNIKVADEAQMSNVHGYLKFGRDFWE